MKNILLLTICFWVSVTSAQEVLVLDGFVEEGSVQAITKRKAADRDIPLFGVEVSVLANEVVMTAFRTNDDGYYSVSFKPGEVYRIRFSKQGYLDKFLLVDTRNFPETISKTTNLTADIAMFEDYGDPEMTEFSQLDYAKCKYFENRNEFRWDETYTRSHQKLFLDQLASATHKTLGVRKD